MSGVRLSKSSVQMLDIVALLLRMRRVNSALTLIFRKKSNLINGKSSLGDGWSNVPSPESTIPDVSAMIVRFPSLLLRLWSKSPISIPYSNAYEYSFLLCAAPARLEESDAVEQTAEKSRRGGHRDLKKVKEKVKELQTEIHDRRGDSGKVRLMFQDEAGFGRIDKPKYCWCEKGTRPSVPCRHIREYRYAYGAVEPLTGESCFLIMPYCNT